MLRFLERMLGGKAAVEDVARETYVALYRQRFLGELVCPGAVLFDIATKIAINRLRSGRLEVAGAAALVERSSALDGVPKSDLRPMLNEAMRRLVQIVQDLQPIHWQVLVMRYVTQMARQDIADRLKISVDAVDHYLTCAVTQCRERLAVEGIDWIDLE